MMVKRQLRTIAPKTDRNCQSDEANSTWSQHLHPRRILAHRLSAHLENTLSSSETDSRAGTSGRHFLEPPTYACVRRNLQSKTPACGLRLQSDELNP